MPVPTFTFTARLGGEPAVNDLLFELREAVVNSLDAAMGKCPHDTVTTEWDLCNACAADTAVAALRELLDAERV